MSNRHNTKGACKKITYIIRVLILNRLKVSFPAYTSGIGNKLYEPSKRGLLNESDK